jgi:hypothetical protein
MKIDVTLPLVARCDNVGAIFMAENSHSGVRKRHIDTRYHFIREHVKYGMITIVLGKSSINNADMFTNNVGKKEYKNLSTNI